MQRYMPGQIDVQNSMMGGSEMQAGGQPALVPQPQALPPQMTLEDLIALLLKKKAENQQMGANDLLAP